MLWAERKWERHVRHFVQEGMVIRNAGWKGHDRWGGIPSSLPTSGAQELWAHNGLVALNNFSDHTRVDELIFGGDPHFV